MLPFLLLLLTATTQALIFKTPVNKKLVYQLINKWKNLIHLRPSCPKHCWNIWKANLTKAMLYKLIKTFQRSSCESNLDCATIPGHNSGLCLPRSSLLCLLSFHSESRLSPGFTRVVIPLQLIELACPYIGFWKVLHCCFRRSSTYLKPSTFPIK